jgi:hypothetical protein
MSASVIVLNSIVGIVNAVLSVVHPVVKKIIIKRNSSTMINVTMRSFLRLIRPSVPSYINVLLLILTLCVYYTYHHESVKNKVYYFIIFFIFYIDTYHILTIIDHIGGEMYYGVSVLFNQVH